MPTIRAELLAGQTSSVKERDVHQHPAHGASIQDVIRIYLQAERGWPARQCDLYDDVRRRDLKVGQLTQSRAAAVTGKPVQVLPGDPNDADSVRAADMFRARWEALPHHQLVEAHQTGTNEYGWTATEHRWEWDPEERRFDPVEFYFPRQRSFRIATEFDPVVPGTAPDDLLACVDPWGAKFEPLVPAKWIVTKRRLNERKVQSGLMWGSTLYSVMRVNGLADWFVYVKRYGLPQLMIRIHDWASTEEHAIADMLIEMFGRDGAVKVPKNGKVEAEVVDGAKGSRAANSDVQQRLVQEIKLELAGLWNGATLSSESGAGGGASYALAKEHGGIRFELVLEDSQRLCREIRRQLIMPWMRVNELRGAPPRLHIPVERVSDPQAAVTIAKELKELGISVDPNQLLELTGFRRAAADDTGASSPEESSDA